MYDREIKRGLSNLSISGIAAAFPSLGLTLRKFAGGDADRMRGIGRSSRGSLASPQRTHNPLVPIIATVSGARPLHLSATSRAIGLEAPRVGLSVLWFCGWVGSSSSHTIRREPGRPPGRPSLIGYNQNSHRCLATCRER
jgi:hypothetical protein